MTKEPWMEEARELLEDYANNVSYGGDPKRSSLTDEDKIISIISTQIKEAREEVIIGVDKEILLLALRHADKMHPEITKDLTNLLSRLSELK